MIKNIGSTDRIVRFVLGAVLVLLGVFGPFHSVVVSAILAILGVVLIVTGAVNYCPIYQALKINTRANKIESGR